MTTFTNYAKQHKINVKGFLDRSNCRRILASLINRFSCTKSIFHTQDTPRRVDAIAFHWKTVDKPSTRHGVFCFMGKCLIVDLTTKHPTIQPQPVAFETLLQQINHATGKEVARG